jgi:hypothetical protein
MKSHLTVVIRRSADAFVIGWMFNACSATSHLAKGFSLQK